MSEHVRMRQHTLAVTVSVSVSTDVFTSTTMRRLGKTAVMLVVAC